MNVRSATVSRTAGARAMSVWSEMPMGPPDPILGLTGEMAAAASCVIHRPFVEAITRSSKILSKIIRTRRKKRHGHTGVTWETAHPKTP